MGTMLEPRSVAFLAAAEGTEQAELQKPWEAMRAQGGRPVLVAAAVAFVKSFFDAGQPVAAICHAPWTLIEAAVVGGRTLTSWPSLRTDIWNAGATWVDEQVAVCENGPNALVTSRKPQDLPAFSDTFTKVFADARTPGA